METKLIENVDGWLTNNEAEFLYRVARNGYGKGVIVEIGSWKGKSTICLAKGSKDAKREKVYAIDPHLGNTELVKQGDTFSEFMKNINFAKVDDYIIPLKMKSEEAAKKWAETQGIKQYTLENLRSPDSSEKKIRVNLS